MSVETAVRYVGWLCQVAGLGLVAYGITRTRQGWAPDRPSVVTQLLDSLSRRGQALLVRLHLRRPRTRAVALAGTIHGTATVQAPTLSVSSPDAPEGATVEDRLALLEERVRHLAQRADDLTRSLAEKDRQTKEAIAAERRARDEETAHLAQRVRDLAAGGLRLESIGLTLLFFGVTLGTVPDGVAWVIRALTPLP